MTGIQPANRKLLDDALAASLYRTAAQVTTEATAQANTAVSAMLTAQKAKPSGLASLGADGLVPANQLPPIAAAPIFSRLSASYANSTAGATTWLDVPGWQLDNITPGFWQVELFGSAMVSTTNNSGMLSLAAANGLLATSLVAPTSTTPATSAGGRIGGWYTNSGSAAAIASTAWVSGSTSGVQASMAASLSPFSYRGELTVTTGGSLKVRMATTSGITLTIDALATLRLTKI